MQFRPEIQGLRGFAVFLVFFYHLEIEPLMGSYIALDIFFVISGFLIFGIMLRDFDAGRFNLVTFWSHRIRRLYPTFIVFLLFTTAAAYFVLYAGDFIVYNRSLRYSLVQLANWYFYQNTGYFDMSMRLTPLIHLWSIATEWQFYIVFPLIALLIHRLRPGALRKSIPILCAAFFLVSFWVYVDRDAAYYLFPFRAWELLFGASLVGIDWKGAPTRKLNAGYIVGCLLIVIPVFLYAQIKPAFPGPAALPACVGTGLIILCHEGCTLRLKKALTNRFMFGMGDISYSLYLVHWPLLAFSRYRGDSLLAETSWTDDFLWLGVAFVLALLLYFGVEKRSRRIKLSPIWMYAGAVALSLLVLGEGKVASTLAKKELETQQHIAGIESGYPEWNMLPVPTTGPDGKPAEAGFLKMGNVTADATHLDFLLVGDSHVTMWGRALNEACLARGWRGLISENYNFLFGFSRRGLGRYDSLCVENGIRDAIRKYKIKRVIVSYFWPVYVEDFTRETGRVIQEKFTVITPLNPEEERLTRRERVGLALRRAMEEFAALGVEEVYVVLPIPWYSRDPRKSMYFATKQGGDVDAAKFEMSEERYAAQSAGARAVIKEYAPNARLIDLPGELRKLGKAGGYPFASDGVGLYHDPAHLSYAGTQRLLHVFTDILEKPVE